MTEAITRQLPAVHARAAAPPPLTELMLRAAGGWAYVTWTEISAIAQRQAAALHLGEDSSVRASMTRTAHSVVRAIDWHA